MPATHDMDCPNRPLLRGESFVEQWSTRKGPVTLQWQVSAREEGALWVAETETSFTGPIVCSYEVRAASKVSCIYTRRITNPNRPKMPT
eukprot:SAG31_NODE_43559_length_266_cov_1.215569_1_plen_88_part_11